MSRFHHASESVSQSPRSPKIRLTELAQQLEVGDVVFIHILALPFMKIASATESWTNHVGIVIDVSGSEPLIAESRFPLSCTTTLSRFVRRSGGARVAVKRIASAFSDTQREEINNAARRRMGILYDTGFNLHSRRQFCSRFVREVLTEATDIEIGRIENFDALFANNPAIDLRFWRLWYFGQIPWQRETVTPASLLRCPNLNPVFDGVVCDGTRNGKQPGLAVRQDYFYSTKTRR
jgi:hypothetical protein